MITIWHNPRCSKSRETLALLKEHGFDPIERHYLKDAPDEAELRDVLARLGANPIDIMRTKDAAFRELGLSEDSSDASLIAAMVANPALIERPIVLTESRAAMGRPPESVLDIL